jgi:hypothetical protein
MEENPASGNDDDITHKSAPMLGAPNKKPGLATGLFSFSIR